MAGEEVIDRPTAVTLLGVGEIERAHVPADDFQAVGVLASTCLTPDLAAEKQESVRLLAVG